MVFSIHVIPEEDWIIRKELKPIGVLCLKFLNYSPPCSPVLLRTSLSLHGKKGEVYNRIWSWLQPSGCAVLPPVSTSGQCPSYSLWTGPVPPRPLPVPSLIPLTTSERHHTGSFSSRLRPSTRLPPRHSAPNIPQLCSSSCYRNLGTLLCPPNKTRFVCQPNHTCKDLEAGL